MTSKRYRTPKGKDERVMEDAFSEDFMEVLAEKGLVVHKWRGFKTVVGYGYNNDYFNTLRNMRKRNESIIMIVTAKPGKGKTYHAMRMGEIFDPDFDVDLQVCFNRERILYLIGPNTPLKRGQVIIIDEAQFTAGARSWFEEVQKMLMNSIAAIRSKGFFIIIVCLHLDMMDKIIRKYVLSFMHHMESRGLATVYRLHTPRFESVMYKNRVCQVQLKLPGYEQCRHPDCLECEYSGLLPKHWKNRDKWEEMGFKPCLVSRARYERNKLSFIDSKTAEAMVKLKEMTKKENMPTKTEILSILIENKDQLDFAGTGSVDWTSIQDILYEKYDVEIARSTCIGYGKSLSRKYKGELIQLREENKNAENAETI